MNKKEQRRVARTAGNLADAWDAVPRDGPAVLVADADAFDLRNEVVGGWIDPSMPRPELNEAIAAVVGPLAFRAGRWVVLDQVRMGSVMVPEELSIERLGQLALHVREVAT